MSGLNSILPVVSPADVPTMTSTEMVEFINADRKAKAEAAGRKFPSKGFAQLQNKDFLAKVPYVLGEKRSAENSADLPDRYGRLQPGYRFLKREACLMAMSYSYDIQAKVFDRMTAAETAILSGRVITEAEYAEYQQLRRSVATREAHAKLSDLHFAAERVETTSQATASVHARELCRRRRQKRANAALLKSTARAMQRDLFADPVDAGRIDLEAALVASAGDCPAIVAVATVAVEAIRAIQSLQIAGGASEFRAMPGQEKPPSIH